MPLINNDRLARLAVRTGGCAATIGIAAVLLIVALLGYALLFLR